MLLHRLLMMAALLAALPAQADIYKWRDEAGRVHYGAVPPPGVELEVIGSPPRPAGAPPSPPAAPSPPSRADRPGADDQDPALEVYQANCQQARQSLATLEGDQPVAQINPDGSQSLLSDEQRQTRLARVRREVNFFCHD